MTRSVADNDAAGFVTAEFAMALPALIAVVALLLGAVSLMATQIILVTNASHAVRILSRGDQLDPIWHDQLPGDTELTISRTGQLITVQLFKPGIVDLRASASALDESR